jgi:hypothetical protein
MKDGSSLSLAGAGPALISFRSEAGISTTARARSEERRFSAA